MLIDNHLQIEELRERLNELNISGAPYNKILELSEELDELIVSFYKMW